MTQNFSFTNNTSSKLPSLLFLNLKNKILGKKYSLSLVILGERKMKKINYQYRKKNSATNVLSFSLDSQEGEILLCPAVFKKQIKKFNLNFKELATFLVIHGMLHLKGMKHSSKMEEEEKKYFSLIKPIIKKY